MKKALLAVTMATQLFAGGYMAPVEVYEPENEQETESKFYVVVAGMVLVGDEVMHGEALLDGNDGLGYGYGIDVGYRLGSGFAVEYDFTYGRNTVNEITENDNVETKSVYYTSALDLVYTYETTENLGIFGKVGYEFEWETISELDIDKRDDDFIFGAGFEYAINKEYKLLLEYEHTMIEGPHGDSAFAGVMFNF